jgi:hypothetical protein
MKINEKSEPRAKLSQRECKHKSERNLKGALLQKEI